jgi:hypothetical protein
MREMVDKVKKGEPLYGKSQLSEYLQGVAARNSRYTGLFAHVIPWFNVVNHNQVCWTFLRSFCGMVADFGIARCRHSQVLSTG